MPDDVADPVAADPLRRDGDRLARRGRRRRAAGRHRRRRRRRRGRPVRRAGRGPDGRRAGRSRCRATSRARRSPAQFGATHIVAERGKEGAERGQGAHRRRRRRRRPRVRRHRRRDEAGLRRRPARARRSASSACRTASSCRCAGCSRRTSAWPAAWRPCARYLPELLELRAVRRHRPRPGLRPARCRSTRSPRATARWTSAAPSRSCLEPVMTPDDRPASSGPLLRYVDETSATHLGRDRRRRAA